MFFLADHVMVAVPVVQKVAAGVADLLTHHLQQYVLYF